MRAGYSQELRIGGQTEYAIIETKDGKVRIRQDDSPRQIGVKTGWISQPPQQIVNLPYRIVVTVVSATPPEMDDIVH
ncbi:NusG domain II-containing protein [Sporomusa aerivorans]|uniref:NusG domain II-containing protein n=1 Tax=Sporomusa aerivorans TaxID=204936 RepID=UPI00352B93E2